MKYCSRCKAEDDLMLNRSVARKDGTVRKVYICRPCQRSRSKQYHLDRIEIIKIDPEWLKMAKESERRISERFRTKAWSTR